ncbi:F-box/LRR-repeat protein 7-like [Ostrinia furnacalis]|uniref:F-box/LRR-repeat protein 7-like n=1 Tax=Ostrinia furnacalis TaxID=93504 RepID=UPI001039D40C|nr:F-box/LRR-repeat protein 7-like [Ostrinia furnacalis]
MTGFEEDAESAIDVLPDEILIHIIKYLPLESILACENVCQRWRKLARDASVWRPIQIVYSGKPGQSEVSEKNLEIISTHSERIYHLKIQYVYSYPFIKSILEKCDNLLSLEVVMCRVGKEFDDDIKKWPNLRKLNMKNTLLLLTNEDLPIRYDQFQDLNYLSLSDFGLTSANCDSLLSCKYLSHILIEKIRNLDVEFITQLIVSKQNILQTLHIYGGEAINDNCLCLLSQCPLLKDLAIIRCENLTDVGLVGLAKLKRIEHLQIWNNVQFTEINLLKTLSSDNLVKLQSLSLSRIGNVSPVIVDVISEYYKNLKFLAVYQCPRIINTDYEKQLKSKFRNIDVVLY